MGKTILKKMDKDEDGLLTEDDLHVGMSEGWAERGGDEKEFEKHFGPVLTEYFLKSDADSDGKLNLEEFQALRKMMDGPEVEDIEDPKTILKNMDKDEDGLLTEEELHVGMSEGWAERGGDEKEFEKHFGPVLKEYFLKSDADSDGKLNLEEFLALRKMMDEPDIRSKNLRGSTRDP